MEIFLPTPSARRATETDGSDGYGVLQFLPTPSARRATYVGVVYSAAGVISTHALREEGDAPADDRHPIRHSISTHALREEGDKVPAVAAAETI